MVQQGRVLPLLLASLLLGVTLVSAGPVKRQFKVFNGHYIKEWTKNKWKFVVMLAGQGTCTGSLVSHKTVLSAAHCFTSSVKLDKVIFEHTQRKLMSKKYIAIEEATPNEDYVYYLKREVKTSGYDVSVVNMVEAVDLKKCDAKIVKFMEYKRPSVGDEVIFVGYGVDSFRKEESKNLKWGRGKVIECFTYVMASPICVGPQEEYGKQDTESGDSGGPLVVEENGGYKMAGTLSGGITYADGDAMSVYAATEHNLIFIEDHMKRAKNF